MMEKQPFSGPDTAGLNADETKFDVLDQAGQEYVKALAEVGPEAFKPLDRLTLAHVPSLDRVKPGELQPDQMEPVMDAKATIVIGMRPGEKPSPSGEIRPDQLKTAEFSINDALNHLDSNFDELAADPDIEDVNEESLQALKDGTRKFVQNLIKYLHAEGKLNPEAVTRLIWAIQHADALGMANEFTPHTGLVRAFNDDFVIGHNCSDIPKMTGYIKETVPADKLEDGHAIEEVAHHKELAQLALLLIASKVKPGKPVSQSTFENPLRIHYSKFKLYTSADGRAEFPLLPEEFVENKDGAENAFFTSCLSSGAQTLYAERINDRIM